MIQRTIATSPEAMKAARSLIEGPIGGKSSYDKLREALIAYQSRPGNTPALPYVDTILGLADHWMNKYGQSRDWSMKAKRKVVENLQLEAIREREVIRAQARYAVDVHQLRMVALSEVAPKYGVQNANTILGGKIAEKDKLWTAAQKIAVSSKLTLAEIAAIRIYSMDDYRYINPAVANDRGWMEAKNKPAAKPKDPSDVDDDAAIRTDNIDDLVASSAVEPAPRTDNIDDLVAGAAEVDEEPAPRTDNIDDLASGAAGSDGAPRTEAIETLEEGPEPMRTDEVGSSDGGQASGATPAQDVERDADGKPIRFNLNKFMGEGAMHGAVLMSALNRLPRWQGAAYRGARCEPSEFAAAYQKGKDFPFPMFTSTSTNRDAAQRFANGLSGVRAGYTTSVVFELMIRDGRDIAKFSVNSAENEILLPPGSLFKVTDVIKQPTGIPGTGVPATEWYIVKAEQVGSPLRGGASLFKGKRRAKG